MSRLVLLSGPSGVGKTTVSIAAADRLGAEVGVSHTTRPMREGEVEAQSYYFTSTAAFLSLLSRGWLMEDTVYPKPGGSLYGLGVTEWRRAERDDRDLVVVMNPDGVRSAAAWMEENGYPPEQTVSIFLMPRTYEELAGRMADRGDDAASIALRLADARQMVMRDAPNYAFTVFNGDGEEEAAIEAVCRIVRGLRTGLEVVT